MQVVLAQIFVCDKGDTCFNLTQSNPTARTSQLTMTMPNTAHRLPGEALRGLIDQSITTADAATGSTDLIPPESASSQAGFQESRPGPVVRSGASSEPVSSSPSRSCWSRRAARPNQRASRERSFFCGMCCCCGPPPLILQYHATAARHRTQATNRLQWNRSASL